MMVVKAGEEKFIFVFTSVGFKHTFARFIYSSLFVLPAINMRSQQAIKKISAMYLALGQLTVSWVQYLTPNDCRVK